jgi:hypothetical protein
MGAFKRLALEWMVPAMSPQPWTFDETSSAIVAADGATVAVVSRMHPDDTIRANGIILAAAPRAITLAVNVLGAFRAMKDPSWNLLIHKALDDLERFLTDPNEPAATAPDQEVQG